MAKWFSTRLYLVTSSRCYAYNSELVPVVEGLYAAWRGVTTLTKQQDDPVEDTRAYR